MKVVVFFKDGRVEVYDKLGFPKESGIAYTFERSDETHYMHGESRKGELAILKDYVERIELIF